MLKVLFLSLLVVRLDTNSFIICTGAHHTMMLLTTREFETSGSVVYPLLCKLVLHLIAGYQNVVDSSADNTVITNILFWLISVARKSNMTTFCMYQQVIVVQCNFVKLSWYFWKCMCSWWCLFVVWQSFLWYSVWCHDFLILCHSLWQTHSFDSAGLIPEAISLKFVWIVMLCIVITVTFNVLNVVEHVYTMLFIM